VVVCPHPANTESRRFRLSGSAEARRAARTYSKVSSVGLAPGRACRGWGAVGSVVIHWSYEYRGYIRVGICRGFMNRREGRPAHG
jgi:hypothetical protein